MGDFESKDSEGSEKGLACSVFATRSRKVLSSRTIRSSWSVTVWLEGKEVELGSRSRVLADRG